MASLLDFLFGRRPLADAAQTGTPQPPQVTPAQDTTYTKQQIDEYMKNYNKQAQPKAGTTPSIVKAGASKNPQVRPPSKVGLQDPLVTPAKGASKLGVKGF